MPKEKKKVNITKQPVLGTDTVHSNTSFYQSRSSRMSFMAAFDMEILSYINLHKFLKVFDQVDGQQLDVTPKPVSFESHVGQFRQLKDRVKEHIVELEAPQATERSRDQGSTLSLSRATVGRSIGGLRLSMDDIIAGTGSFTLLSSGKTSHHGGYDDDDEEEKDEPLTTYSLPYIKVTLRLTECIPLYAQYSQTALKDTREGNRVEEDNKVYDYLTTGKGKVRRRSEAEVQTDDVLVKSRDINTMRRDCVEVGTYVSFFEMFDTYKDLEKRFAGIDNSEEKARRLALVRQSYGDQCASIVRLSAFKQAQMVLERCLAGNVHENSQRRFRNMTKADPFATEVSYAYTLRLLFRLRPLLIDKERKATTDISFCPKNGDILAVAYGIYSFSAMHVPSSGLVLVWNIKNPDAAERKYIYTVPVASVEFSQFVPTLLAIGLYDGSVEVRDITHPNEPAIAVSQRTTSPGVEPVVAIKWIKQTGGGTNEIDPFLTLSQDGSVTKFRIINSPYLLGFKQMQLDRIEGAPEGLWVPRNDELTHEANRNPQGLNLCIHPQFQDIYYVLTDEGCLLKCSTNYTHQYLEVWKTHVGSVNNMDFSPWSPKLFLTCGNDWSIRIWVDGIFKPLLTLQNHLGPMHCAYWSHTHSTVIISVNRKTVDIWDICRNTLKPVNSATIGTSHYTTANIALCGRSIGLGTEGGSLLMCAFDDMPFPAHFQYYELEKAIYKAIATCPDLIIELKSVGYFGYPHKELA